MSMCPGCGNEVEDLDHCPICEAGRAPAPRSRARRVKSSRCSCPRCDELLEDQSWEGIVTLSCPTCRGTFFPDSALETVLDKLRKTCDPVDADTVLKDFKDRFHRQLPDAVRYKHCPVCDTVMTRRAYGTVSGVIIDACGDHGTWVDEAQFAALADFICRGGDILAAKVDEVRERNVIGGHRGPAGDTASILGRFLGGGK
jgi:Zn-finger nucleic acid-binding protein